LPLIAQYCLCVTAQTHHHAAQVEQAILRMVQRQDSSGDTRDRILGTSAIRSDVCHNEQLRILQPRPETASEMEGGNRRCHGAEPLSTRAIPHR